MSDTVFKFGAGKDCTAIEVAPFTPICSKPAVPGSEALTLEVPAPVFAPVVPPQECACFTFTGGKPDVTVTMKPGYGSGTGTANFGIAATGDCCNGAYEVTSTIDITVPECVTLDRIIYSDTTELGYGGSITCTLGIRDCVPYFEMSSTPMSITLPDIQKPCLADTSIKVQATYHDADGKEQTTESDVDVTSSVDEKGCLMYSFGDITLDLTGLPTGGFGNGGSVFKDNDDNNLYTDGGLGDGATWYGGGIGDRATNTYEDEVFCRGPKMRGYGSPAGSGDHPVPYAGSTFQITTGSGSRTATAWCSRGRASDDPDAVGATPTGYADGNLSMVMPTGFQWHAKGLAINLCDFVWNESGLLSVMEETGVAALVSPAPSLFKSTASAVSNVTRAGMNASGLAIYPDTNSLHEPGLSVNDGRGLRIFGLDGKTTGSGATETWSANRLGTLEVYGHSGDFQFNYDGKMVINDQPNASGTNEDDVRVKTGAASSLGTYKRTSDATVSVVSAATTSTDYWGTNSKGLLMTKRPTTLTTNIASSNRSAEIYCTQANDYIVEVGAQTGDLENMRLAIFDCVAAMRYLVEGMGYARSALAQINGILGTLGIARMHFGRAGTLMAVDTHPTCAAAAITRHYTGSAS